MAVEREFVLLLAGNAGLRGNVFSGHAHRFGAVKRFHARVDETPAQRAVVNREVAPAGSFGERVGRAAHVLHPASHVNLAVPCPDSPGGQVHGRQTGSAQAVDRQSGHFRREPCQQRSHARHVAVVLTSLVGAAKVDFVNHVRVNPSAPHNFADNQRGQVVRADG